MHDDDGGDNESLLAFHPVYMANQLFEMAQTDLDEEMAEFYARVGTTLLTLNSLVVFQTAMEKGPLTEKVESALEDMEIKGNG